MYKKINSNIVVIVFLIMMLDVSLVQKSKWNIIFNCLIFGVSIFLIVLRQFKKIPLHIFAFISIVFLGILSMFIQPICNIPDEQVHLARAEYLSEGKVFVNQELQKFEINQSLYDMFADGRVTFDKSQFREEAIDTSPATYVNIAASNIFIEYIPQAIGVSLAKLLKLNTLWLMWLGRLVNLVVYALLVCLGIKLATSIKTLLMFIAILPISIQQAASLSPDAMINGLAIFTVGYFVYLFEKKKVTKSQLFLFVGLCMIITICKVTNICFGGLILLLPDFDNCTKKKQLLYKWICIILVGITGCLYYYYTLQFAPGLWCQSYLIENNVNSSQQINYIVNNFGYWLRTYLHSLFIQFPDYLEMLNYFGWFEVRCAILTPVMVFIYTRCCFRFKSSLKYYERGYILLLVGGIYFLTHLAMYLGWTSVGATNIAGVQGRYFIPALALLSLHFYSSSKIEIKDKTIIMNGEEYDIWVMILMVSYYLFSLVGFYYR